MNEYNTVLLTYSFETDGVYFIDWSLIYAMTHMICRSSYEMFIYDII